MPPRRSMLPWAVMGHEDIMKESGEKRKYALWYKLQEELLSASLPVKHRIFNVVVMIAIIAGVLAETITMLVESDVTAAAAIGAAALRLN